MEQRSDEWFEARRGRITASMVGAILGHAPYMTRDQAMRRMVRDHHKAESEFSGNVATEYGKFNEEGARFEYELETGNTVQEEGFLTREEWAGASPDGLLGLTGGLEIKCPFGKRKITDAAEFLPLSEQPHYFDQIQFSLWVSQRATWDFFQWASGATKLETVMPDAKWRSKNLPKLRAFYADFLAEREQPLAQRHLDPLKAEIDTPEAAKLLAQYDELAETIDNAKGRLDELKSEIVAMCKDKSAVICGRNVTKVERAGSVAYAKAIKAIAPDADLEPYRGKPSTSWKIG